MQLRDDYYAMALPPVDGAPRPSPELVDPASPRSMRDHVERFARYFLRELGTGGIQFEASETRDDPDYVPYEAYLFNDGQRHFGACCFRLRNYKNAPASWWLDWAWLHRYFRSRGYLSAAWPQFMEKYGHFHLEAPLSHSMQAFLKKVGWNGN
jgi:hypothetical protein